MRFDCGTRYYQMTTYKYPINNLIRTPIDNIHLGLETLTWYYTFANIVDDSIILDKIIKNESQKLETKIKHEHHQLTVSNKIHAINKIIPGAYMYNFSLHPTETHPSGDLFINDYEIWIEHELCDDFLNKFPDTSQISIMIITNEFRLMHYYLEQNKSKCKFIKFSDINENSKQYVKNTEEIN